jgi:peptidyl-tRNA hydrolase
MEDRTDSALKIKTEGSDGGSNGVADICNLTGVDRIVVHLGDGHDVPSQERPAVPASFLEL